MSESPNNGAGAIFGIALMFICFAMFVVWLAGGAQ